MQSLECYSKFIIKINKTNTGANRTCDKGRFVLIFNEAKNRWVAERLKDKNSIIVDNLQQIIKSKEILNPTVYTEYVDFDFTDDFYEFLDANCVAQKEECRRVIRLREVKNPNKQILYTDVATEPSFEYEWSFLTIQDNKIRVYKKDFDVLSLNVEYYGIIPDIDIAGYTKIDGTPSTNISIDIYDQYVDQIINRAVEEFMRDYENQTGLTVALNRTQSES